MTHDTAVRTIVSLVPEIEKSGAETVLLDYAERENLPPAQLEKLAQVFNTLRTVDHIDKSASADDRGKSVDLVDVPVLVTSYIVRTKQEKTAASLVESTSSHDASRVDLMSAVRFDAPVMAKAAAAPTVAAKTYNADAIADLLIDAKIDARLRMEKLAGSILRELPLMVDGSLDASTAVADARHRCREESLKRSVEWLKSASVAPLFGTAMDSPLVKRAFAHTGNAGKLLVEFNEEFETHRLMTKLAVEVAGKPDMSPDEIADLIEKIGPEEVGKMMEDHARDNGIDPASLEPPAEPDVPSFVKKNEGDADTEEEVKTKPSAPAAAAAPASSASSGRVSKVLSALGAPVRAAGKVVGNSAAYAQNQIERISSKDRTNKDQMRSDMDVEDVRRAIGLRRMIGTDPVLKESDPREVLEIYNAISRTNPEIVHNMPALRLLLREAVSYEGLTLDSQKQLTDIRSNSSKSEEQEANNLKRRYTTGGGDSAKPRGK